MTLCIVNKLTNTHRSIIQRILQALPHLTHSNTVSNPTPSPLQQADHPMIDFWYKHEYKKFLKSRKDCVPADHKAPERGGGRAANGENVRCQYIQNTGGEVVTGFRTADMRRHARSIFAELAKEPSGPPATWTASSLGSRSYYYKEMCHLFPELRLCDLNWKAERLAIDIYPSFYLKRANLKEEPAEPTDFFSSEKRPRSPSLSPHSPPTPAKKPRLNVLSPVITTISTSETVTTINTISSASSNPPSLLPQPTARPAYTVPKDPLYVSLTLP